MRSLLAWWLPPAAALISISCFSNAYTSSISSVDDTPVAMQTCATAIALSEGFRRPLSAGGVVLAISPPDHTAEGLLLRSKAVGDSVLPHVQIVHQNTGGSRRHFERSNMARKIENRVNKECRFSRNRV